MFSITAKSLGLAVLALLVVVSTTVSAQKSLECQTIWKGPSATNDVLTCLASTDRLRSQWKYLVFPGFCALLFLVLLVSFPMLFLCVSCCCCCCKPSSSDKTRNSRCCLWMWIIYAILWSCAVCILVIYGVDLLSKTSGRLLDDTISGPLQYFNNTGERIIDFTSNWTTGTREPINGISVDLTAFNDVSDTVNSAVSNARDNLYKYINIISIVSYCVGAVGVALVLLIIPFACCHCCIPCFPLCISCAYWFFGFIFALLAVVGTLLAYFTTAGCGEVSLQYNRQPGIFQWYLVPYCQQNFDFATANAEVRSAETKLSNNFCSTLLEACDNTPTSATQKPLKCGNDIVTSDQCPNFDTVASVVADTTVKADTMACPTPSSSCTLAECQAGCSNADIRNAASTVLYTAAQASNASIAVSYVRPLLDCNFIVDTLVNQLDKCDEIKTGSVMLGVGFFVGGIMFGLAIYIMFRGSCVWGKLPVKE